MKFSIGLMLAATIILVCSSGLASAYQANNATYTTVSSPSSSPDANSSVATPPEGQGLPDTVVCIAGFLIFLFFLYRLFVAGKDIKHSSSPSPENFKQARQAFRESKGKGEILFVMFLCSPMFVRYSFFAMFAAVATAGFAALGGICGLSPESLRVIFDGINRLLLRIEQLIKGR